jgi:CRISPR-associated protein Cmr1
MARQGPKVNPPRWETPPREESLTLEIEVITPMFGGGYEPRKVDEDCPIRAAAIRGHLRFWWRATVGASYSESQALFAAEQRLWGSAETPGQVAIKIQLQNAGHSKPCAHYDWDQKRNAYRSVPTPEKGWPAYALHPFQGQLNKPRIHIEEYPTEARMGIQFKLTLVGPADELSSIQAVLAAWIKYGGIGARTRRGCGSLNVSESLFPYDLHQVDVSSNEQTVLPGSRMVLGPEQSDPIRAWSHAVETYKSFRQKVGFARNPGKDPRKPGRSRWPEADSVRHLTGMHAAGHNPTHPVIPAFPRADLGLPIVFHFMDRGEPEDATLQGPREGMRRLASPVITKAIQIGTGRFKPLILVLNAPHAWRYGPLDLNGGRRIQSLSQERVELSPQQRQQVFPLLDGQPIRDALLDYVAQQWKTRVEVCR